MTHSPPSPPHTAFPGAAQPAYALFTHLPTAPTLPLAVLSASSRSLRSQLVLAAAAAAPAPFTLPSAGPPSPALAALIALHEGRLQALSSALTAAEPTVPATASAKRINDGSAASGLLFTGRREVDALLHLLAADFPCVFQTSKEATDVPMILAPAAFEGSALAPYVCRSFSTTDGEKKVTHRVRRGRSIGSNRSHAWNPPDRSFRGEESLFIQCLPPFISMNSHDPAPTRIRPAPPQLEVSGPPLCPWNVRGLLAALSAPLPSAPSVPPPGFGLTLSAWTNVGCRSANALLWPALKPALALVNHVGSVKGAAGRKRAREEDPEGHPQRLAAREGLRCGTHLTFLERRQLLTVSWEPSCELFVCEVAGESG